MRPAAIWEGLTPPYRTIVADPPWDINYNGRVGVGRPGTPGLPYSTMGLDEICAMPVGALADADAVLWLWITAPLNRAGAGLRVAQAWGFRVTGEFVWDKPGLGVGRIPRTCHEILLVAKRGDARLNGPLNIRSVQQWPTGGHSVKPQAFFDLVEQVSPGPYVELFARAPRLGWDHWGHGYESGAA